MQSKPKPASIQTLRVQGLWVSKSDHLICPDFYYFVTDCHGNLVEIKSPLKYFINIITSEIF